MKKPSAIFLALALALALAGFAPLGWAQDASMTDTESGTYTEGDATAVAFSFAVSGEVPQFLLNLISNPDVQINMVDGAASGQVSFVQAPAAGMGEGSGSAWTGGTTSASRTLPEGDVVYSYTAGGTAAEASYSPIDEPANTAYALGVLIAGGGDFGFTVAGHPAGAGAIGALSGSATSTRLGTASAGTFGDASASYLVAGDELPQFAGVRNTLTAARSFSTTPETYAAGAGFVAAGALSGGVFETPFAGGFSGINSLGVVRTSDFYYYSFSEFNPRLGGFEADAAGEAETDFRVDDLHFLTRAVGETEAGGLMEVDPTFIPQGTALVGGELWAHAGKNALAVGFGGVDLGEQIDHPVIPEFFGTIALVDAAVYARDFNAGSKVSGFQAEGYARFFNPPLEPADDDDDDNGGWTDYDPLAVITRNGQILSSAAIGAGFDGPAEGTAALSWKVARYEDPELPDVVISADDMEWALTGVGGLSASVYFPNGFDFNIGPAQGSLQELSTTDYAAFSYVRPIPPAPLRGFPDIQLRSYLSGLYGEAATPNTRTQLLDGSAFSNLSTLPTVQIAAGSANELLSGTADGPGAFSFALGGNLIQYPFGAGFGLSIGAIGSLALPLPPP